MNRKSARTLAASLAACLVAFAAAAPALGGTSDAQLLRTYQPVTYFHPEERFHPTSVQSFVADADLEQLVGGAWVVADPEPESGALPGPGTGIWRLNQDSCTPAAPIGGLACYAAAWGRGSGGSAVYGRVARLSGATVLQYWYFYYHNAYSYFLPPSDVIWQAHEGDWEVVNVVLTPEGEPVQAAYSQHCLGERRAWAGIRRWDGTHPIVYVAAGSHANYFEPGLHRFDARCVPADAIALLTALGLPLPSDYAAPGELAGPSRSGGRVTTIRNADEEAKQWLAFPGFWGELQYFRGPIVGTVPFGLSPVGPAYQRTWFDPLGTIALWPEG